MPASIHAAVAARPTAVAAQASFGRGHRVAVNAGGLNYRQRPGLGAAVIMVVRDGTQGEVLDGPVHADGYTWWQLGLPGYGPDGNPAGWAAGTFLVPA